MSSVKWNNSLLSSYGIIVENVPTIIKAKKNIETFQVEGRSGYLSIDKETYAPFTISLNCHMQDNNASIDQVKAYLDGCGKLSLDGVREYGAIISNQIDLSKVINFRRFIIQFLCQPIAKDIVATTKQITQSSEQFTINGATTNMYPIYTLEGTGTAAVTINNEQFTLTMTAGKKYILDAEAKVIVDQNNNNLSADMSGSFPHLKPGENNVSYTGTITSFKIEYKKAYL